MTREPDFEAWLGHCIERLAEGGEPALASALSEHPSQASRVRQRLADLDRLGLLERQPSAPERIGRHRILKRLGRGGMGTVYLAEEEPGGRRVALKLASLPAEADGPEERERLARTRARFAREVAVMAQLAHPHLVAVRASGEHEGRPWFSMDHVPGVTLSRVIARLRVRGSPPESLTARDVRAAFEEELEQDGAAAEPATGERWSGDYASWCCRVALDVATALEHAHAHGVLHRDVKPSNVLLAPDGRAQLFDFGLAHVEDQAALTRSGDIAGTPYAVAPEQIDSQRGAIDGRTDVWGLGVLLFELLALRRPFDAPGAAALLRRILDDDAPPVRRFHPGLRAGPADVCATALERTPRRRYADMTAMRADLERLLAGQRVQARGAGALRRLQRYVWRRPAQAAAAALAIVVLVGVPIGLLAANAAVREQARRAERAADDAQRQAAANAEVVAFLVGLFRTLPGDDAALQQAALAMIENQAQGLELRFGDQPLVRAALLEATGTVYANLEQYERALPLYDRALAIRQSRQGEAHVDTARLIEGLARVHLGAGDPASARDLSRRALAGLQSAGQPQSALAARAHTTLGRAESALGSPETAAAELAAAVALLEDRPTGDGAALAEAHEAAADVAHGRHDAALGLRHAEQALAALQGDWFPQRRVLVRVLDRLARLRDETGDVAGASAARRAADTLREADGSGEARIASAVHPALALETPGRDRYESAFQAGITALQARRLDESIQAFAECLALRPSSGVCLYNQACGHALAGRVDAALDCLERAEALGFGLDEGQVDVVRRDADLAALRDEPRWQALLDRLGTHGEQMRAWTGEPGLYVPAGLDTTRPLPLLVVLHADGSNKQAVLDGPWRLVADRLGSALLVPSARRPLGPAPADGLQWVDEVEQLDQRPWTVADSAFDALNTVFASHTIDRRRVRLAGEGSGALLAFDLALRAPGLVRGVLILQGPARAVDARPRALTAAALGVRVALWIDPTRPVPWTRDAVPPAEYADALAGWLASAGLLAPQGLQSAPLPESAEARADALAAALASIAP